MKKGYNMELTKNQIDFIKILQEHGKGDNKVLEDYKLEKLEKEFKVFLDYDSVLEPLEKMGYIECEPYTINNICYWLTDKGKEYASKDRNT